MSSRILFSIKAVIIALGAVLFLFLGSVLPRLNTGLFASPDETAVSIFAGAWTPSNGFRIRATAEDSIKSLVSLHPRSMIRQGDWLVPVGFLGMPFIVSVVNGMSASGGAYLTLLLVLSSAIPFYFLLKKFGGSFVAWFSVLVYLSFPTVLLYVNRGLFPNLPVVALTLWAMWLLRIAADSFEAKKLREWVLASGLSGLCLGLGLMIRPIEAIWIIPWIVWLAWSPVVSIRRLREKCLFFAPMVILLLFVGVIGLGLSMSTYPFHSSLLHQPVSGYQLKDYIPSVSDQKPEATENVRDVRTLVPIAFHPRVVIENIRIFFLNGQGIWFGTALIGGLIAWWRWKKRALPVMALSVWTFVSFCLLYGQTVYMDNINGVATLGNSFLRYALPLVPLIALGCALSADALRRVSLRGAVLGFGLVGFLSCYGIAYALNGDGESILETRKQLVRYQQIRSMASVAVSRDSVILSERSDKIFASGPWVVASPIPDRDTLTALKGSGVPVYFFHRIIETDADVPKSIAGAFMVADPLVILDNEALYSVYASEY